MSDREAEEALEAANQALENSITPGPCCDRETEPLRWQIINLLLSEACQDMSFIVGQIRIDGSLYRAVVEALRGPKHKIHIRIDPSVEDKGLGGEYDPSFNRLILPFARIDGKEEDMASRCETIVHECTHACIDYGKARVLRSEDEVASWFAGALFLRGQGLPITGGLDFRKNLRALAEDARKANVRGKTFKMPEKALAALKADIVHVYKKRDKSFNGTSVGVGDGF